MIKANYQLINQFEQTNTDLKHCNFLLIGDSHTFVLNDYIKSCNNSVVNIAINGETTKGLLLRFERNVQTIKFESVIIQLGYNDLKYRFISEAIENYKLILHKLECRNVYIISIFPVNSHRIITNRKIIYFNTHLQHLASLSPSLRYVDVFSKLYNADTKGLLRDYALDYVHLNERGNKFYFERLLELTK